MSTSVSSVVNHFPSAENGFTTTTSGSISSGATTVGLNSVAGYTNGEIVVFVIDPSDVTKKQTFTGTMDTAGSQVTDVVWTAGTNQTHSAGATVVDYATATHISMITKGLRVEHNQDGTHGAITTPSIVVDDGGTLDVDTINEATAANGVTIDGLNIKDSKLNTNGSVIPNNLVASTGTDWAWQSWTPTFTNLSGGTLNYAKYTQIGKTIHFRLKYTLAGAGVAGSVTFTTPTSTNADYSVVGEAIDGLVSFIDTGTAQYTGFLRWASSTTLALTAIGVGGTYANGIAISSTIPHTWANTDIISVSGTYEVA